MKIAVTLIRSTIKRVEKQKRIAVALGLHKMHQTRVHNDTPAIRGMIYKVRHLVEVKEIDWELDNSTNGVPPLDVTAISDRHKNNETPSEQE